MQIGLHLLQVNFTQIYLRMLVIYIVLYLNYSVNF